MPTITIDIPTTAHATRVANAFASHFNYQAMIDGESNPETKQQFAKRMIAHWIKMITRTEEAKTAQAAIVIPEMPDVT